MHLLRYTLLLGARGALRRIGGVREFDSFLFESFVDVRKQREDVVVFFKLFAPLFDENQNFLANFFLQIFVVKEQHHCVHEFFGADLGVERVAALLHRHIDHYQ